MWTESSSGVFRARGRRARSKGRGGVLPVLVPALLVALGLFAVAQAVQWFTALPLFTIREVQWEGLQRLRKESLETRLGPMVGQNIFRVDLKKGVQQIAAFPGVKEISIRRALPDRIILDLRERKPAALLIRPKSGVLADEEGVALELVPSEPDSYPDLPHLFGEGIREPEAVRQGLALANFLEISGLKESRVIELGSEGDMVSEWEGVRVHWGSGGYPEKLHYLRQAAEDLKKKGESYREADLRFDHQVVIRR